MAIWGRGLSRKIGGRNYDRGLGLFDRGLYEEAIESFEMSLAEPRSGGALTARLTQFYLAECYSALAHSYLSTRSEGEGAALDTTHAIHYLQRAIELRPGYADLHYHLGRALYKSGRSIEALSALNNALDINANYARAALQMGITLYSVNRHEEAFLYVDRAVKLDSTLRAESLAAARFAHGAGDLAEALQRLKFIGNTPHDEAITHAKLAASFCKRGQLREGIAEYHKALALKPEYADLRNQLGIALFAMDDFENAAIEFGRAVAINPSYVDGRVNLALALEKLGRDDEAIQEFDIVLAADGEHPVAREHRDALAATDSYPNEPATIYTS